jgi:hypothetical protein
VSAFAIAGAVPLAGALTGAPGMPLAVCPGGEDLDVFTGHCLPGLVPNSPGCPPGVHGSVCGGTVDNPAGPIGGVAQPTMPAPPPMSGPAETLEEVSTPGY